MKKASEAYNAVKNKPDNDAEMKIIKDQFQQFKKSKIASDQEKVISSGLDLVQTTCAKLYSTHRLHLILYGSYEDPENLDGPFTYTNSGEKLIHLFDKN